MPLDFYATERHFADHLAAVWRALPSEARGDFIVHRSVLDHCRAQGIQAILDLGGTAPIVVASYGDERRVRGMRRHVARFEHGAGQAYLGGTERMARHPSYAGGRDCAAELLLCPNEYSAALWRKWYPGMLVEVVGSTRLDSLPALEGPEGVVCVSFHWDCLLVQEARTTYYTYRAALPELARRFPVIGHGHPRALDGDPRLRRAYMRLGIELVEDFDEVCRRASVYVCDNSSSMFEFAATGRPVVVLNEPVGLQPNRGYRREVAHGLRFWDAAGVGPNVWAPAELLPAVERAMECRPEDVAAREAALDIVYVHRHGAAERAASVLCEWAGERQEVAA
jgi:hypothetical protein